MEIDTNDIESMAYRLIRIKARDVLNECSNEQLGEYVRGVVDLQTALYAESVNQHNRANEIRAQLSTR